MRRLLTFGWLALCLAVIAGRLLLPLSPALVDTVYTRGLYRGVASVLVPLTGSVTLPVTPIVIALLLVWLVLSVVLQRRRGWRALGHGLFGFVITGATLYALFIVLWGANYARTPLETRLSLSSDTEPSTLDVIMLSESLGNIIRQTVTEAPNWERDVNDARTSLQRVTETLDARTVTLPRYVKRTPPGLLLVGGRATGITIPWTLEAYVDRALPYPVQLATALHELAHVAGYAGEAEADFITGLAGLTSQNPSLRYSVALSLFERSARGLTPERLGPTYEDLPARAKKDLNDLRRAYNRYKPPQLVTRAQARIYDSYLKGQGVRAGIADYDRVAVLLMAAQRDGLLEFNWEETLLHPPD